MMKELVKALEELTALDMEGAILTEDVDAHVRMEKVITVVKATLDAERAKNQTIHKQQHIQRLESMSPEGYLGLEVDPSSGLESLSPEGYLSLEVDPISDIRLTIYDPDTENLASVEFCPFLGGGSEHTYCALQDLFIAMIEDQKKGEKGGARQGKIPVKE